MFRLYNASGDQVKTTQFNPGGKYTPPTKEGSFEMRGNRVTKLGTNMYAPLSTTHNILHYFKH